MTCHIGISILNNEVEYPSCLSARGTWATIPSPPPPSLSHSHLRRRVVCVGEVGKWNAIKVASMFASGGANDVNKAGIWGRTTNVTATPGTIRDMIAAGDFNDQPADLITALWQLVTQMDDRNLRNARDFLVVCGDARGAKILAIAKRTGVDSRYFVCVSRAIVEVMVGSSSGGDACDVVFVRHLSPLGGHRGARRGCG